MERSDEQLMQDYREGDREAMQLLFMHNKVRIINFCFSLLKNRADAEEVAGDVFLALIKHQDTYDSQRTFSTECVQARVNAATASRATKPPAARHSGIRRVGAPARGGCATSASR